MAQTRSGSSRRLEYLVVLPVLGALLVVWGAAVSFKVVGRDTDIEQARSQLTVTHETLADLDELAEKLHGTGTEPDDERTAAIWRALLHYPAVAIWVEENGRVAAGQRPGPERAPYIFVTEARSKFSVRTALPVDDALEGWRQGAIWGGSLVSPHYTHAAATDPVYHPCTAATPYRRAGNNTGQRPRRSRMMITGI